MKCIYLLFYFILISSTIADNHESCKIQGYSLIQNQTVLLSFKETIRPHNAECDGKYWLYMSNKNIKSISENAFSDLQIYGLKIKASNNGLELFNKSFSGLPFLKSLYFYSPITLRKNNINIFEKLGELINLQLVIRDNKIFHTELLSLEKLEHLIIYKSELLFINIETFSHSVLPIKYLEFNTNKMEAIEGNSLSSFKILNKLEFNSNRLKNLSPGIFDGLDKLERLIIHNELFIKSIEKNAFKGLSQSLKTLTINYNYNIEKIDGEAFAGLKLKTLDLRYNLLAKLEKNIFKNMEVEYLDISCNRIIDIMEGAFNGNKIKFINIYNLGMDLKKFQKNYYKFLESTEIIDNNKYNLTCNYKLPLN